MLNKNSEDMNQIKWLLCVLCCLWMGQAGAQKKLVVTQQEQPTAFFPESGKACVELISPLKELNITSTFGEKCTCELNSDKLYVYRFVFDLSDEPKRTLYISAPGFVREELKLSMSSKQKLFYTVFPPEDKYKFDPAALIEYVYSGTAPVGVRVAFGKRFGVYAGYKTSMKGEEGMNIEDVVSYYDVSGAADKGYIRESYTAGVRIGIQKWMYLYLGGGYGKYARLWENPVEVEGSTRFMSDSQKGPEAELGLSFRVGNFALTGGVDALIGDKFLCDYQFGLGYYINFKKRR